MGGGVGKGALIDNGLSKERLGRGGPHGKGFSGGKNRRGDKTEEEGKKRTASEARIFKKLSTTTKGRRRK